MATQQIKDILNTEVPKPSFVLSPSVPAPLPSGVTVTRNGQDNAARTLDPYSGKFKQVGEDTPRLYGSQQQLLLETTRRTNQVRYSADINPTNYQTNSLNGTFDVPSIIANDGGSKSFDAKHISQDTGSFTNSVETASAIFENDFGGVVKLRIGGGSSQFNIAEVIYNFETGDFNLGTFGAELSGGAEVIDENGPGVGGQVVRLHLSYDPTLTSDGGGSGRELYMFPAETETKNIIHHAQLEEAPNASSPIVTKSAKKTRAGDVLNLFSGGQPDYWNTTQGTFIITTQLPVFNNRFSPVPLAFNPTSDRIFITRNPPYNVKFRDDDGVDASPSKSFSALEVVTIGLSLTEDFAILSANGSSDNISYDGDALNSSKVELTRTGQSIFRHRRIIYFPRALPEPALNILTS
jgi:hypothetical protein